MHHSFGPWSTALGNTPTAPLSAFWQRRMALLSAGCSKPYLGRREFLSLGAGGLLVAALPTLRQKAGSEASDDDAKPEPLPRRIYMTAFLLAGDKVRGLPIVSIDPNTGTWKTLVENGGNFPRVSPDGQTLAWVGADEGGVWNCDTTRGENPARITDHRGVPHWSSDSKTILVAKTIENREDTKQQRYETWRLDADGTNVMKLSVPDNYLLGDWSPDGRWLVRAGSPSMVLLQLRDNRRRVLPAAGDNPRFSPDGRRIVFERFRPSGVHVIDVDGNSERQVFQGSTSDVKAPCWSPDGRHVALVEQGERSPMNTRVFIIEVDGEEVRTLDLAEQDGLRIGPTAELDWRGAGISQTIEVGERT